MIKVNVLIKDGYAVNVSVIGHANYDDYGKDIVCSAASSIVTTTVNGILSINDNILKYENNSNDFKINILEKDDITNKLVINMINLLKELSSSYPKNIQVKEEIQ